MAMIVPKVDVKKTMKTHIDCVTTMIFSALKSMPNIPKTWGASISNWGGQKSHC
jgi:hypothetical protein